MSFTSPLFVPTRRRPTISPCFTSRSCSTMRVSLPGEKRSIRWKLAIGSLGWRLSTTRSRSSSTGWNSDAAVYSTSWVISSGRISYCQTAHPRSAPRKSNTNESRVAGMAVRSNWSGLVPDDWAAAELASSRKQSQRIGLENGFLVGVAERERQELVDVQPHVLHTRAGPVRAPQHAVGHLGQAGKVLEQPRGRDPGHVEPHPPGAAQHEERPPHIEGPAAVHHDDPPGGEVDRPIVELHRIAELGAPPRGEGRSGGDHHGEAAR